MNKQDAAYELMASRALAGTNLSTEIDSALYFIPEGVGKQSVMQALETYIAAIEKARDKLEAETGVRYVHQIKLSTEL